MAWSTLAKLASEMAEASLSSASKRHRSNCWEAVDADGAGGWICTGVMGSPRQNRKLQQGQGRACESERLSYSSTSSGQATVGAVLKGETFVSRPEFLGRAIAVVGMGTMRCNGRTLSSPWDLAVTAVRSGRHRCETKWPRTYHAARGERSLPGVVWSPATLAVGRNHHCC